MKTYVFLPFVISPSFVLLPVCLVVHVVIHVALLGVYFLTIAQGDISYGSQGRCLSCCTPGLPVHLATWCELDHKSRK